MEIGREYLTNEVPSALFAMGSQPSVLRLKPKLILKPKFLKPTVCRPIDVPGLAKIVVGNEKGWEAFLPSFMQDLERCSKSLTQNDELGRLGYSHEDLFQDVLASICNKDSKAIREFHGLASMKGYLYSITKNKFLDLRKKQHAVRRGGKAPLGTHGEDVDSRETVKVDLHDELEVPEWASNILRPDRFLLVKELDRLMIEAIRSIGKPYSEPLELVYRGYNRDEIAEKTNRKVRTVDSQICRGKKKLERAICTKRHEGLRHAIPKRTWENFVEKNSTAKEGSEKE